MNEYDFKKGIEDIKREGLSLSEKNLIHKNLESYISSHNIKNKKIISQWWVYSYSFILSRQGGVVFSVLVLTFLGFNGFYKSQNSLPGDTLYPLKVSVVEPLKLSLTTDPVSKVDVVLDSLNNRIKEAEILESEGRLSDSVEKDLEQRLKSHKDSFDNILSNVESLKSRTDSMVENAKIDLEAKVNAHSKFVKDKNSIKTKKIIESIHDISDYQEINQDNETIFTPTVFSVQAVKNAKLSTTSVDLKSFEDRKKTTEKIIKESKKNIERAKKNKVNKKLVESAEESVKEAEESFSEANKYGGIGNINNAYSRLLDSRRMVKEADTTIDLSQNIEDKKDD